MRWALIAGSGAALLGASLGGCSLTGTDDGTKVALATPVVPPPGAPADAAPQLSMGPFLEGPIGARLAGADRESAFRAETDALSTGDRKTWRGQKGIFGFVVPGPAPASGTPGTGDPSADCRGFTHTIYFSGRPQVGHGTGCRTPDGSWRITG